MSVVDDCDSMRYALGLIHVMRREKDGSAFGLVEMLDVRPELISGLRIEAERRLVEEGTGVWRRPQGEFEAALHPSGKSFDSIVAAFP